MSIYIDNGKTIKEYATDRKIEKAIEVLLDQMESVMSGEILKEETKDYVPKDAVSLSKTQEIINEWYSHWAAVEEHERTLTLIYCYNDLCRRIETLKDNCIKSNEDDIVYVPDDETDLVKIDGGFYYQIKRSVLNDILKKEDNK